MLDERFSQYPLEAYSFNVLELDKINYFSMTLIVPTLFQNQKVFKPITTSKVRYKKYIKSDRTSSLQYRERYKNNNPCYLQKFQTTIRYLAIKTTQ